MSFYLIEGGSQRDVSLNMFREEPFSEEHEKEISEGTK